MKRLDYSDRVLLALTPAALAAWLGAGTEALLAVIAAVAAASGTRFLVRRFAGRETGPWDADAAITGIVVALLSPPGAPLWIPAAGAAFGVAIASESFGGRERAVFHPGVTGWLFATLAFGSVAAVPLAPEGPLLFAPDAARLAGVSGAAVILGGASLLPSDPDLSAAPAGFLAVAIPAALLLDPGILSTGAAFLVALFVATDRATSPEGYGARFLFGVGVAGLAALYGAYGGYVDGLVLSVLVMNGASPWLDRFVAALRGRATREAVPGD